MAQKLFQNIFKIWSKKFFCNDLLIITENYGQTWSFPPILAILLASLIILIFLSHVSVNSAYRLKWPISGAFTTSAIIESHFWKCLGREVCLVAKKRRHRLQWLLGARGPYSLALVSSRVSLCLPDSECMSSLSRKNLLRVEFCVIILLHEWVDKGQMHQL